MNESTMTQLARRMLSAKAEQFTESVIREMTRLAMKHNAVNLSQGFPDFAAPAEIKEAARQAISDEISTPLPGARSLCATPLSKNSSARRESASIPNARSRFAAAPRKR
jgi:aspartate/methionine/tyrosine aminotransferase